MGFADESPEEVGGTTRCFYCDWLNRIQIPDSQFASSKIQETTLPVEL